MRAKKKSKFYKLQLGGSLWNQTQRAGFGWASVSRAFLNKPLVRKPDLRGLLLVQAAQFSRGYVYPERCQSRRLSHLSEAGTHGAGAGSHKSLVRTRRRLLSMLTSQTPCGSVTAACGSISNPSSLSSRVRRWTTFPPWELWQRKYSEGM